MQQLIEATVSAIFLSGILVVFNQEFTFRHAICIYRRNFFPRISTTVFAGERNMLIYGTRKNSKHTTYFQIYRIQ